MVAWPARVSSRWVGSGAAGGSGGRRPRRRSGRSRCGRAAVTPSFDTAAPCRGCRRRPRPADGRGRSAPARPGAYCRVALFRRSAVSSVAPSRRSATPHRARALLVLLALATAGCGGREVAEARGSTDAARERGGVAAAARPPLAESPIGQPPVAGPRPSARDTSFAATIARLSEPGGYFDTDNLVSNETSVLHVLPTLERRGVRGGAYIGVGPEQNFSYIAAVRPAVAYIVDIRRDNLLQHLWYKALFALARDPAEFLLVATG